MHIPFLFKLCHFILIENSGTTANLVSQNSKPWIYCSAKIIKEQKLLLITMEKLALDQRGG